MSEPEAKVRFKRGDVREDGRVYWDYRKGEEYWITPDHFTRKKQLEKLRYKKLVEEGIKDTQKTYVRGDVRSDGHVFWHYHRGKEYWVTPESFRVKTDKARETSRKWREKNPEKERENARNWQKQNKEKNLERIRAWQKQNSERVRELGRKRYIRRKSTNPLFQLSGALRARIYDAFRRIRTVKPTGIENILGTTVRETKAHIESQFQPGMSWENYGKWHVDHVIPLASAKTAEELVSLCHHLNLQPLWASDNIRKGAKMPDQLKTDNA
jgi:hypothetical protein